KASFDRGMRIADCGFITSAIRPHKPHHKKTDTWLANRSSRRPIRPTFALRATVGNLRVNHERRLAEAPGSRTQPPRIRRGRPILKTGRATGPRSLPIRLYRHRSA